MTYHRAFAYVYFSILIVAAFAGQTKISVENGVTIVTNAKKPSPPQGTATRLVLEEIFAIEAGTAVESAFSDITTLDVHKDGTVFVLDRKESRVSVFDANGRFLRAFGKKGQGPGELNQPVGILISPNNEIVVEDILNQRLAFFGLDGTFQRSLSTGKALGLSGIRMDGQGRIIGRTMGLAAGGLSIELKMYDKDLNVKKTIVTLEMTNPLQAKINPFRGLSTAFEMDSAGQIYLGSDKDYEIKVISAESKSVRVIRRAYDAVPITKEDKDEMLKLVSNVSNVNVKDMIQFPATFPPYAYFLFADDRLLVRTYEKERTKKNYFFDVFDAEGRYIAKLSLNVSPRLWRNGRVYAIDEDDEGYKILKCLRARWEK